MIVFPHTMEIINTTLATVTIVLLFLSFLISKGESSSKNKIFSLFIISISLWSLFIMLFRIEKTVEIALTLSSIFYVFGAIIPASFLHFSYIFPNNSKVSNKTITFIYFPIIIIILIFVFSPNILVNKIDLLENTQKIVTLNLYSYIIYSIYFVLYTIATFYNLIKSFLLSTDIIVKKQLRLIFIGTIIPYMIAIFFNLILPLFNYQYIWIGPTMSIVVILVITYSIFKHQFLNIKLILPQLLVGSIWLMILVDVIYVKNEVDTIYNVSIFILTIIIGAILLKSILIESNQREILRILNETLEERVTAQTSEISKSYELEKNARRELEKLIETKDQFILITQHHIRSPVYEIKSEIENAISKLDKNTSAEIIESLKGTRSTSLRLGKIIDDFVNISTLKVGSQILTITNANIKPILENILSDLKVDIRNSNIEIIIDDQDHWPEILMDSGKIHEALLIIIENAISYNFKNGTVRISTKNINNIFEITIINTGIGITYSDKNKLFGKIFYRSEKAKSLNPIGMGVGLSIAKAIVKAHHGELYISSEGENMGAKVIFSLPLDFMRDLNLELGNL